MVLQGDENSSLSSQEDVLREVEVNSEVSQLEEHAESQTSLSGTIQTAQTPPQTEGIWTCHDCGWTFPNAHPSAKHKRSHRKNCGKIKTVDINDFNGPSTVAVPSDEVFSDEEEHQKAEHVDWSHQHSQGPKVKQIDSHADRVSNSLIPIELGNLLKNDIQNVWVAQDGVPNSMENDMSANELHCNLDPKNQVHSILESTLPETSQMMIDEGNVERTAAIIPEESVTMEPTDSEKVKFLIQEVQDSSPPGLFATELNQSIAPKEENLLGLSAELQHETIVLSEGSTSVQNFDAQTSQSTKNSFRENEQTHLTEEIPVQNTVEGSSEGSEVDATQNIVPAMSCSAHSNTSIEVPAKPACEDVNVSDFGKEPSSVHIPIYEKHISSINGGDPVSISRISEDSWTCRRCGWTYPNAHPSAKHRRNHRRHCGQYKGFKKVNSSDVAGNEQGSSDEACSDDEKHVVEGRLYTGHEADSPTSVAGINHESSFKELQVVCSEGLAIEVSDLHITLGNALTGQDNGLAVLVANAEKELLLPQENNAIENAVEGSSQEWNEKFPAEIGDKKEMQDGHSHKQLEGFRDHVMIDVVAKIAEVKGQADGFSEESDDTAQQIEPIKVSIGAADVAICLNLKPSPHGDEEAEAMELPIIESYSSKDVKFDRHQVSQPLNLVEVCIPSTNNTTIFAGDDPIQDDLKLRNFINHTHFVPITEDDTRAKDSSSFPLSPTIDKLVLNAHLLQLSRADSISVFSGMESSVSIGDENTRSTISEAEITYGSVVQLIDRHSLDLIVDPQAFGYESPRVETSDIILPMNDGARNLFQQGRTPELWEQLLDAELEKKDLSSLEQNISDHLLLLPGDLQPEAVENLGLPGEPNLHPEQMGSLYIQENFFGPPAHQTTSLESTSVEASVEHGIPDRIISSIKPSLQHYQAPSFQTLVSDEYRLSEQQQSGQGHLREMMDNGNSTSSNLFTLDWEVFDSSQDQSNNSADSCVRTQKVEFYPFGSSNTSYDALEYRKSDTDDYQGISKAHTPLKFLLAEDSGPKALTETRDNARLVKDFAPSPKGNPLIKRVLDKVMSSPASFGGVKPSRDKPKVNSKWSACICCSTMN